MDPIVKLPSEDELQNITSALHNLDQALAASMSHIRKVQKLSMDDLCARFSGLSKGTVEKYLQASYQGIRPIHFVAAFSWVTMVPATSFFKGIKLLETDRGMDEYAIDAIIQCGRLSKKRFQITIDCIYDYLNPEYKRAYDEFYNRACDKFGDLDSYDDEQFLSPPVLDVVEFAEDYYSSIALALKDFRRINQLSVSTLAKALGLSIHRYKILEDPYKSKLSSPFSMHAGFRVRLAFHSHSHVEFTQYMKSYPQFHTLRKVQHLRDALIVEGLRYIPLDKKKNVIEIMEILAR